MDVTSLLNTSSAARLQRRDSVASSTPSATGGTTAATSTAVPTPSPERTPPLSRRSSSGSRSRSPNPTPNAPRGNRTPWDAGGYSLPILTLDTKSIHIQPRTPPRPEFTVARPGFYRNNSSESPIATDDGLNSATSLDSPKQHKFSDSRSSLCSSSYTTASSSSSCCNNSVSHSRISSLSTVSEFQPLTSLITEISLVDANANANVNRMPLCEGEKPMDATASAAASNFATNYPVLGAIEAPSPTPIHQRQDSGSGSASTGRTSPEEEALILSTDRPRSPSDAVMIRRGQDQGDIAPEEAVSSESALDLALGLSLPISAYAVPHRAEAALFIPHFTARGIWFRSLSVRLESTESPQCSARMTSTHSWLVYTFTKPLCLGAGTSGLQPRAKSDAEKATSHHQLEDFNSFSLARSIGQLDAKLSAACSILSGQLLSRRTRSAESAAPVLGFNVLIKTTSSEGNCETIQEHSRVRRHCTGMTAVERKHGHQDNTEQYRTIG
ncbi:hypothetical protein QBC46DRAFT_446318 [Diplogelasinospora grovesii]|uniref:Uncharacterized protein n=1 Tax=Diplogelasinospora grovesii TaxID=303347 RepID=A0AAN6NEN9_9PEZI|nr:hypothetical protein QBC46DRAFT_446318 [Diplogelasinospora grovesii]